jgi:hypothetical protein
MQPRQDDDVQQPEAPSDEAKALVAALTQQLAVGGESSSLDAATSSAVPEALNRESTRNQFFNDNLRDRESVSLSPPSFLGDQQVRQALQRANSLRPQGHLDDEPYFPSTLSDAFQYLPGGGRENRDARVPRNIVAYEDRSYPSTSSVYFVPHAVPSSSTPSYPQDALEGSSGVSGKFKPGQETESVLKLTKRPKLREKDVAHRRSLGQGNLPAVPHPVQHKSLAGFFPSTILASHFLVLLTFGSRQVGVPGSPFMTIGDLRNTAGAIAECDPAALRLIMPSLSQYILMRSTSPWSQPMHLPLLACPCLTCHH